jgi:outer membrane protein assembly factor BamC
MRSLIGFLVCIGLVALISACSTTNESLNYRNSEITPTLEIPPDLISRSADSNLALPGSKVGTPENTGRYVETGNLNIESRVLPEIDNISLQGQGDLHWLEIDMPAQKLYPLIRNFWIDQGFTLSLDEPAVGVMETEWLSQVSGKESFFASMLESLRGAESKDQYKIWLERGEGGATRVYLAHREQEFILHDEQSSLAGVERSKGWQYVPSDPAKEYEMLSRLMLFLGMQDDKVRAELEKLGLFAARASLQYDEGDDETYLVVKQGFEQSWNRLRHRLEQLNVPIVKLSQSDNDGEITIDSKALPTDLQPAQDEPEQVKLAVTGSINSNTTRVDVLTRSGTTDRSEHGRAVLQYLLQQMK